MKIIPIKAIERDIVSNKRNKSAKRQGFIPGVLYGKSKGASISKHFYLEINTANALRYQTCFVDLTLGKETFKTIVQGKQYHPVSDDMIHIDFFIISKEKDVKMDIPIAFEGKSAGVLQGGLLVKKMRKVKVKAPMDKMPDFVTVDISTLGLGQSIRVKHINMENIEILSQHGTPIATVEIPRSMRSSQTKESSKENA